MISSNRILKYFMRVQKQMLRPLCRAHLQMLCLEAVASKIHDGWSVFSGTADPKKIDQLKRNRATVPLLTTQEMLRK